MYLLGIFMHLNVFFRYIDIFIICDILSAIRFIVTNPCFLLHASSDNVLNYRKYMSPLKCVSWKYFKVFYHLGERV